MFLEKPQKIIEILNKAHEDFAGLNSLEFVTSKSECYCGIRSIKKRLQEIKESVNCLLQILEVQSSGDHEKIDEFCTLQGYSKTFRNIIYRQYYEEGLYNNFSQQKTVNEFGSIIKEYETTITDTESNTCELCHQLNSNTEMASISNEAIEKYCMFFVLFKFLDYIINMLLANN